MSGKFFKFCYQKDVINLNSLNTQLKMLLLNKKMKNNDFCLLKYSTHMIETINFISGYRNDENNLFFYYRFLNRNI